MGILPVPTWKSTEAAPTPISDGPASVPSPTGPWQVAQFERNNWLPVSMSSCDTSAAVAVRGAASAQNTPTPTRASSRTITGANRLFLRAASAFTNKSFELDGNDCAGDTQGTSLARCSYWIM